METPSKKQIPTPSREDILEQWVELGKRKKELEKELQKVTKKKRKLEEQHGFLGNVLGIVRGKEQKPAATPQKKRKAEESMDVDGGSRLPPKEIKKRIFTEEERAEHRRRGQLENKKKQLEGRGKQLPEEEQKLLAELTRKDEERKQRFHYGGAGEVNPLEGQSRGAFGGGFVPSTQGVPESPFHRTGTGLDVRGDKMFP
ncbi:delta antigen [Swiss snake colony virus 1]|uniref:Delta antigen n=1 Tax=Snake deltavirus F18-5 TaxID=2419666 RepID=A0A3G1TVA1_9VIRU|nr:delta antigen [Snake deltavirus F18-5]AYF55701.1 delta antigen [Snake deltavirus F18-5]